jgi:hypothetical protein
MSNPQSVVRGVSRRDSLTLNRRQPYDLMYEDGRGSLSNGVFLKGAEQ